MSTYDFIFGAAGSGKSRYIYDWLSRSAAAEPDKKFYLFVPEQNTFKAQRAIIEYSEVHGMLNLDVLSFQLLFYRVMEELGIKKYLVLDDMSKSLLIRKAALDADKEGSLRFYSTRLGSRGFIEQLKNLISEFMQYDVSTEGIRAVSDRVPEGMLKSKLEDVSAVYERFNVYLKDRAIVPEEMPAILMRHLADSELLKNSVLVFDGYTGFTPIQLKLIEIMLSSNVRARFSFTIPEGENPYRFDSEDITDLWWLSKKNIAAVIEAASRAGAVPSRLSLESAWVGTHAALRKEDVKEDSPHIFISKRPRHSEGIYINPAENIVSEVREAIRDIKYNALEKGIRYKRMAMIVTDPDNYNEIIKREMSAEDIPYFMDDKAAAIGSPIIELFRSAFAIIHNGVRYDEIIRFIKNPILTIDDSAKQEVYELDNLFRKSGIRSITALKKMFSGTLFEEDIECVLRLKESLSKGGDLNGMIDAVRAFATEMNLEQRLQALADRLECMGMLKEAYENRRFLGLIDELFSRLKATLGREASDTEEFINLLEACFINMKGGMIPETMDMLTVGDLKRSRIDDIDVLYILGANEGLLPSSVTGGGIFSDLERIEIERINSGLPEGERFELAPDDTLDSCIQSFYLYLMMNKPSKRLVISYAAKGRDERTLKPSGVIKELENEALVFERDDMPVSVNDALRVLAEAISHAGNAAQALMGAQTAAGYETGAAAQPYPERRAVTGEQTKQSKAQIDTWEGYRLYRRLLEEPSSVHRAQMIMKAAFYEHTNDKLSKQTAERLYSKVLSGSVSRLEQYEQCPFAHFISYGLRLKEREKFDIEAIDFGNLYHGALNFIFTAAEKRGTSIASMDEAELNELCDKAVNEVIASYRENRMFADARSRFLAEKVGRITKNTINTLKYQLDMGEYQTLGTELEFKFREGRTDLYGKIDRVDYAEKKDTGRDKGKIYVKVIDYKSGDDEFDIDKVRGGLQLQLAAYTDFAVRTVKERKGNDNDVIPAGMFYYNIDDPSADYTKLKSRARDEIIAESAELKRNELRMNGAVLDDMEVLESIDRSLAGKGGAGDKEQALSTILKGSKVLKRITPLTSEEFDALREFISERMRQDAEDILDGNIEAKPYRYGSKTGCEYCRYKAICGFEPGADRNAYRWIKKAAGGSKPL